MRKIVNSTYVTLDGVIKDPQDWPELGSFSDTGNQLQNELLGRCDAVVMGRHTYEGFAPVWSGRSGDPYTDRINAITKYVVSTTLTDPQWENTIVIDHDPIDAIRTLREQSGGDIVQYGFGALAHQLMGAGLLDELRLWLHPFLVGTGTSADLLYRAGSSSQFTLADSTTIDNGVIILTYRAAAADRTV